MGPLPLRAALVRGALVAAANWPVILVDFAVESFFKVLVAVPVVGGALMVAAVVGADLGAVLSEGIRSAGDLVLTWLAAAPIALVSFLAAVGLVALAGEVLMFVLKAGTLDVIITGERQLGDKIALAIDTDTFRSASAYSLEAVYGGVRRFGRRAVTLALGLGASYLAIGAMYLAILAPTLEAAGSSGMPAWPLVVLVATSAALLGIAGVNLAFDLLRVIVISDDCGVREAIDRLRTFVIADARQVIGIFATIWGIIVVATAASLLAAGGLGLVALIPVLSLVTAPLQLAAWMLRGLVFQYLSTAALAAYGAQYRRRPRTL